MPEQVDLSKIKLTGGTQSRFALDEPTVARYTAMVDDGIDFDPVELVYDGEWYYPTDGFHRVEAHKRAGRSQIAANVSQGTLEDAQWSSYGANGKTGLPRSQADTRRAVAAALKHPRSAGMSNRDVGRHVHCDKNTVRDVRAELEARGEIPRLTEVKGADGKTYPVKEKVDPRHWVAKEWAVLRNAHPDTQLLFLHRGIYLSLQGFGAQTRYDTDMGSFQVKGSFETGLVWKFDQGFVDVMQQDGIKLCVLKHGDRSPVMKLVVESAARCSAKVNRLTPLTIEVEIGQFVRHKTNGHIGRVLAIERGQLQVGVGKAQRYWRNAEIAELPQTFGTPGTVTGIDYSAGVSIINGAAHYMEAYEVAFEVFAQSGEWLFMYNGGGFFALGVIAQMASERAGGEYRYFPPAEERPAIFLTSKEVLEQIATDNNVAIVWVNNQIDYMMRPLWQLVKQAEEAEATEEPAGNPFAVGDRVSFEGRPGTVRYVKPNTCGVYMDASKTTHHYDWRKLERLPEESKSEPVEVVELRKGDHVVTRTGHQGVVTQYGGDRHVKVRTENGETVHLAETLRKVDVPMTDSPTGETALDVLAILYELQEAHGGWVGGALVNLNGTEAGLLEQQRIIKLQRRAPSGGIMAWYQITPAGCYDLQRPVLPVAPAPQDEYYPSPDAKAERSSVIFQLNERLIEVRDLLQRLESLDSDLHGQLNIAYTTMRVQVFQALETPGTLEELEQLA